MRVCVLGGCGHVGLPLGLALATAGVAVVALDIDKDAVDAVNAGHMPFRETGADEALAVALAAGAFRATSDPVAIQDADIIVVVIGTPVDDHLNPDPYAVVAAMEECIPYLRDGQLILLRSTIYPGVTRSVQQMIDSRGLKVDVAFCPERILEGHALQELRTLPQIVGAFTSRGANLAVSMFDHLGVECVELCPEEAELAKLFTNTWRYIKFAAANQFWMMANEAGYDFSRIRDALMFDYPRASDMPGPGFSAGPCLFKDTMQLGAFTNNTFALGHAAMLVNEGQPLYVVEKLAAKYDLRSLTVGILGMAFKAESDDPRSSLSYKLKHALRFRARDVLTSDPYVRSDHSLLPLQEVLDRADILIVGAPHRRYASITTEKPVVDIWNLLGNGSLV